MTETTSGQQAWATFKPTAWLAIWALAWTSTLAVAKFGPEHWWDPSQTALSWGAIAINVLAGIGWIVAYAKYLRSLDELWRKINLDALAITLGAGWVVGFAFIVIDAAGLVENTVNIALLPVFLAVVYVATIAAGYVRYR